jgi:putative DNA primase/helicase
MTSTLDHMKAIRAEGKAQRDAKKAKAPARSNGDELFIDESLSAGADPEPTGITTMCAKDAKPMPIKWIWKDWLARGKFHLIAGSPEAGKTTILIDFAAAVSAGGMFPDGAAAPKGNVLMWTSEDDITDTLVPRFIRTGADLSRIHFVRQTIPPGAKPRPFNPATDLPALVKKAEEIGDVAILAIDPLAAVMPGNRDSHKAAETRNGLQPVLDFTEAIQCATVGIAHLTKGTAGRDPLERVNGSGSFGQLPRIVMFAAKNGAEGEDQPGRIMVRVKNNIGKSGGGFGYRIDAALLGDDYPDIEATRIVWGETLIGSAREILDEAEPKADDGSKATQAKRFLETALAAGPRPQKDVEAEAKAEGISSTTLFRASKDLVIKEKEKVQGGGWTWRLAERYHARRG